MVVSTALRASILYVSASVAVLAIVASPLMSTISDATPQQIVVQLVQLLQSPIRAIAFANFGLVLLLLLGRVLQLALFGAINNEEFSALREAGRRFTVLKGIYVFSALYNANNHDLLVWISLFAFSAFMRAFILLAKTRLTSQSAIPDRPRHVLIKLQFVLLTILALNIIFTMLCYDTFYSIGWASFSFIMFDPIITSLAGIHVSFICMMHLLHPQGLEDRSSQMFYVERITDIIGQTLTIIHLVHIWSLNGFSFSIIDIVLFVQIRCVSVILLKRFNALRSYRKVMHEIHTRFPDATIDEIAALDDHCAICRETMDSAKKLPCTHMFHVSCLRQWMKYRRTCPICRASLLAPALRPVPREAASPTASPAVGALPFAPIPPQNLATGTTVQRHRFRHLLHFNTRQWASWLPNFSLAVIRGFHGARTTHVAPAALIERLHEMFPNVQRELIAADLQRTANPQDTIDRLIAGLIRINENDVSNADSVSAPQHDQTTSPSSTTSTLSNDIQTSSLPNIRAGFTRLTLRRRTRFSFTERSASDQPNHFVPDELVLPSSTNASNSTTEVNPSTRPTDEVSRLEALARRNEGDLRR